MRSGCIPKLSELSYWNLRIVAPEKMLEENVSSSGGAEGTASLYDGNPSVVPVMNEKNANALVDAVKRMKELHHIREHDIV